jgi:FkbM family methyltransferase
LGANDGVDQSNTLHFELFKNWRGVLIEPTPHNFFNCLKNRAAENSFFCNACVSFDFKEKFVEIAFSNLMSTPIGLESDISNPLEHAQAGKKYLNPTDEIFIFGALAKSLNEILTKSSAPNNIDLLSLDVEGAELEVLKGIDHNMYRFKYMCVESHFNPEKIRDYLQDKNYSFVEKLSSFDYLFVDNSN